MRLGCTSGFSEDIQVEKMIEYSFEDGDQSRPKIKFNIVVETYQPVFDPTTETDANNYMKGIGYRIYEHDEKNDGEIEVTSPSADAVIPKGIPLMIEWDYTREGGIIQAVDSFWLETNDNEWNLIEKGIDNHEFWYWNIPEDFTDYKTPAIQWGEDSSIGLSVYREPIITIIPNLTTNIIDADSFTIINPGYFMAPGEDASINIVLEMKDDEGRVTYTGDSSIYLTLTEYKVGKFDSSTGLAINPVWVDPNAPIVFPGTVDHKVIDIHIANSANNDVFGPVRNITIV